MNNATKYNLYIRNSDGAGCESTHATIAEVRSEIRSWDDPRSMTAEVCIAGELIYAGRALGFVGKVKKETK